MFSLDLKNYEVNNPLLNITWTLTPAPLNQSLYFLYSVFNNTLTIKKGALK